MHTNTKSGSIGVNWDAIGAVSEIIGAAGVIASMLNISLDRRPYIDDMDL